MYAGLGGQAAWSVVLPFVFVLVLGVLAQLVALNRLGRTLARAGADASDAVERLTFQGGGMRP